MKRRIHKQTEYRTLLAYPIVAYKSYSLYELYSVILSSENTCFHRAMLHDTHLLAIKMNPKPCLLSQNIHLYPGFCESDQRKPEQIVNSHLEALIEAPAKLNDSPSSPLNCGQ